MPLAPVPFRECITLRLSGRRKKSIRSTGCGFFYGMPAGQVFPPRGPGGRYLPYGGRNARSSCRRIRGAAACRQFRWAIRKPFPVCLHHHVSTLSAQPFDYLVTACATCAAMINTLWPRLSKTVAPNLTADLTAIAEKTMDISQFLSQIGGIPAAPPSAGSAYITVTYHDPCHLKNALGITREPRQLIRANPQYHLVEMDGASSCCGMGGTFNWRHYGLSTDIGSKKRDQILATGASVVATSCPACMMQLSDMLAMTVPG